MSISTIRDPIRRNAWSLFTKVLRPEVWYRRALENDKEEKEYGEYNCDTYDDPNGNLLTSIDADPIQEDGNAAFYDCCWGNVG